ncbi:Trehalose-6-P synthase/phosphatase complex subunit, partial [Coemansia sp. RSA 2671]
RRRSTFSVNAVKLAPISRTSPDGAEACGATSPNQSLEACAEADGEEAHSAKPVGASKPRLGKLGPSQLAYNIEEAAGAHTPPVTTLDFTRKQNLDFMREKREQKTGAGKHGRLLREHHPLLSPAASAPPMAAPPAEFEGYNFGRTPSAATAAVSQARTRECTPAAASHFNELAAAEQRQQQDVVDDMLSKLHIDTAAGGPSPSESPDVMAAVPGTSDQFVVEHLNVGNIGLFNAVNASLDLFAERVWIGELGISTEGWSEERKTAVSNKLLDEVETYPVFVSDAEFEGHYGRFSKQLIWPAFHYIMPEMPQWHGWEKSAYEAALATCERFADRIVEIYRSGDIIW